MSQAQIEAVKNGAKECEGTVCVCHCVWLYVMCVRLFVRVRVRADKKATLEEVVDQHTAQL